MRGCRLFQRLAQCFGQPRADDEATGDLDCGGWRGVSGGDNGRDVLDTPMRSALAPNEHTYFALMLEHINSPVALFTPSGLLIVNNTASKALYTRLQALPHLSQAYTGLQLLFATDVGALHDAMMAVADGRVWRGLVRIPVRPGGGLGGFPLHEAALRAPDESSQRGPGSPRSHFAFAGPTSLTAPDSSRTGVSRAAAGLVGPALVADLALRPPVDLSADAPLNSEGDECEEDAGDESDADLEASTAGGRARQQELRERGPPQPPQQRRRRRHVQRTSVPLASARNAGSGHRSLRSRPAAPDTSHHAPSPPLLLRGSRGGGGSQSQQDAEPVLSGSASGGAKPSSRSAVSGRKTLANGGGVGGGGGGGALGARRQLVDIGKFLRRAERNYHKRTAATPSAAAQAASHRPSAAVYAAAVVAASLAARPTAAAVAAAGAASPPQQLTLRTAAAPASPCAPSSPHRAGSDSTPREPCSPATRCASPLSPCAASARPHNFFRTTSAAETALRHRTQASLDDSAGSAAGSGAGAARQGGAVGGGAGWGLMPGTPQQLLMRSSEPSGHGGNRSPLSEPSRMAPRPSMGEAQVLALAISADTTLAGVTTCPMQPKDAAAASDAGVTLQPQAQQQHEEGPRDAQEACAAPGCHQLELRQQLMALVPQMQPPVPVAFVPAPSVASAVVETVEAAVDADDCVAGGGYASEDLSIVSPFNADSHTGSAPSLHAPQPPQQLQRKRSANARASLLSAALASATSFGTAPGAAHEGVLESIQEAPSASPTQHPAASSASFSSNACAAADMPAAAATCRPSPPAADPGLAAAAAPVAGPRSISAGGSPPSRRPLLLPPSLTAVPPPAALTKRDSSSAGDQPQAIVAAADAAVDAAAAAAAAGVVAYGGSVSALLQQTQLGGPAASLSAYAPQDAYSISDRQDALWQALATSTWGTMAGGRTLRGRASPAVNASQHGRMSIDRTASAMAAMDDYSVAGVRGDARLLAGAAGMAGFTFSSLAASDGTAGGTAARMGLSPDRSVHLPLSRTELADGSSRGGSMVRISEAARHGSSVHGGSAHRGGVSMPQGARPPTGSARSASGGGRRASIDVPAVGTGSPASQDVPAHWLSLRTRRRQPALEAPVPEGPSSDSQWPAQGQGRAQSHGQSSAAAVVASLDAQDGTPPSARAHMLPAQLPSPPVPSLPRVVQLAARSIALAASTSGATPARRASRDASTYGGGGGGPGGHSPGLAGGALLADDVAALSRLAYLNGSASCCSSMFASAGGGAAAGAYASAGGLGSLAAEANPYIGAAEAAPCAAFATAPSHTSRLSPVPSASCSRVAEAHLERSEPVAQPVVLIGLDRSGHDRSNSRRMAAGYSNKALLEHALTAGRPSQGSGDWSQLLHSQHSASAAMTAVLAAAATGASNVSLSPEAAAAAGEAVAVTGGSAVAAIAMHEGDLPDGQEGLWFEVTVSGVPHPDTGETLLLVVQHDVTARVWAERQLARVVEAEHNLLEGIFPQHVIEHIAVLAARATLHGDEPSAQGGGDCVHTAAALLADAVSGPAAGLPPPLPQQSGLSNSPVLSNVPASQITGDTFLHLATSHSALSVLFCDIQGFTPMCGQLPPVVVMAFLNDLFTRLDGLLDAHGVYKVETIGDCYVAAGGLMRVDDSGAVTVRSDDVDPLHAHRTVQFAKALLRAAATVKLPTTGQPVKLRVGIHSGPAVSGVVGTRMPRFCLFGDTMNTASRMESTGVAGAIHVSQATRDLVPGEAWESTGGVDVKGKGRMLTYLLRPEL